MASPRTLVVAALFIAACSSSTDELLPDGAPRSDLGGAPGTDSGPTMRADAGMSGLDFGMRAPQMCSGLACAAGELRCYSTGHCFDPATSSCGAGDVDGGDIGIINPRRDGPPPPCGSDADCRDDEFCNGASCGGGGLCYARDNCGSCGVSGIPGDPPLGTDCEVCGCNGTSYGSPQEACRAGVRVTSGYTPAGSGCGADPGGLPPRRACGLDSQCPTGQSCCTYYGFCMDTACTYCCAPPPPGASLPCTSTDECTAGEYCAGDGCGTVGGCVRNVSSGECTGELAEVCGCDGHDYTNECWALAARTRVSHAGRCH